MAEVFVGRIGPLPFGGALYVGVATDGPGLAIEGASDQEGLRQLAGEYAGATLVCAPELAEAAAALGWATRPPRPDEARMLAIEAWNEARAAGPGVPAAPEVSARFLETAATYVRSAVHERWPLEAVLELELTAGEASRASRAVVVAARRRVSLLPSPTDALALLDLSYAGDREEVRFDPGPDHVSAALEGAGCSSVVPIPGQVSGPMGDVKGLLPRRRSSSIWSSCSPPCRSLTPRGRTRTFTRG